MEMKSPEYKLKVINFIQKDKSLLLRKYGLLPPLLIMKVAKLNLINMCKLTINFILNKKFIYRSAT